MKKPPPHKLYNCKKCPAYCCSYPFISVTDKDLERIAGHLREPYGRVRRNCTFLVKKSTSRVLCHKTDEWYATVCIFLDTEKRACSVYDARPDVCRGYPSVTSRRCGYYDFLTFERRMPKRDENHVAVTNKVYVAPNDYLKERKE